MASRAPTPLYGDQEQSEIWVMDQNGGGAVQLTHNTVAESHPEFSPDGSQILFVAGANQNFDTYYDNNLFIMPAGGGMARLVLPDFTNGIDAASWSKDGQSVYLMTNVGVHSELQVLDLAARKVTQLTDGDHALGAWTFFEKNNRHMPAATGNARGQRRFACRSAHRKSIVYFPQ